MEIIFCKNIAKSIAALMAAAIKKPLLKRGKLTENKYCVIAIVKI